MVMKDIRFPAYPTMFHPNTGRENSGLQDIQNQKQNNHRREGEGQGEKKILCQLDPYVSVINGHKAGNLFRDHQSAGVGSC